MSASYLSIRYRGIWEYSDRGNLRVSDARCEVNRGKYTKIAEVQHKIILFIFTSFFVLFVSHKKNITYIYCSKIMKVIS